MYSFARVMAVLLEDLARHVERQVVAGDDTPDEAEPGREQLLAVVHDPRL